MPDAGGERVTGTTYALPRFMRALIAGTLLLSVTPGAMSMDVRSLWDFNNPALSEQRFRDALAKASPEETFILQTQIARSYGLRNQFDKARGVLKELQPGLADAGAEGQTRYWLELGRTYSSAAHAPETQTPEVREQARADYQRAWDTAQKAGLDALAIDALHMMAFVDTAPEDQLKWGEKALAVAQSSNQPAARAWEASLRNNIGYALHQLGRYDEALDQFQQAVRLREQAHDAERTRIANWMVAWTLRSMGRIDEALAIQLRLEQELDQAGEKDPYVYDELAQLYRAKGDGQRAEHYAQLKQAAEKPADAD